MRLANVNKNKVLAYLEMDHFSSMAQQPLFGQCLLIIEISLSHSDTLHSLGLSGRVISSTQRPLPDTTLTKHRSMPPPPVGFEPAIPTCERPQTHALDRGASRIDEDGSSYTQTVTCRCLSCTLRWPGTAGTLNCWHIQTHDTAAWHTR
jgi:hypothetical protein